MTESLPIAEAARWCFILGMTLLAVHDIVTFRIPNIGNLLLAAAFLAFAPFVVPASGWLQHFAAAGLVFAAGMVLFYARALGGGDVKLMAAGALWVGFSGLLEYVLWVGLFGGALAVGLLLLRRSPMSVAAMAVPRVSQSYQRLLTQGEKVPYGVAIAAGAIKVAWHMGQFPA